MADPQPEQRLAFDAFRAVVLGVLFSLTFEEALGRGLSGISAFSTVDQIRSAFVASPGHHLTSIFQLFAFLLTLARFYGGAYRFCAEAPTATGFWSALWDIGNAMLLFVGFYVAALLVQTTGAFLLFVASFHVIDLIWFGVGGPFFRGNAATELAKDYFILFDVVTIAAASAIGLWWSIRPFDPMWIRFWTASLLVVMFVIDVLIVCRDLYFNPSAWATKAATRLASREAT